MFPIHFFFLNIGLWDACMVDKKSVYRIKIPKWPKNSLLVSFSPFLHWLRNDIVPLYGIMKGMKGTCVFFVCIWNRAVYIEHFFSERAILDKLLKLLTYLLSWQLSMLRIMWFLALFLSFKRSILMHLFWESISNFWYGGYEYDGE